MVVSDLLVESFPDIMDPTFTAGLEDDLDRVAEGQVPWHQLMQEFYGPFAQESGACQNRMRMVKSVPTGLDLPGVRGELVVRWGKNGEFVGCAAYPKCGFTGDFSRDAQGGYPGGAGTGRPGVPGRSAGRPRRPGANPAHRAYLSQVRQRPAGAPGAAGRIFGLLRLPQVPIHPELCREPEGKPVPQDPEADAALTPAPGKAAAAT